ncbi:BZ3500_MvSof-1268-A1-R1_Chr1-1g01130 [Microbotryum saponariae]|uniref:E3 ubiquitin-protein ligase n=1 Tax=Microbotryum saponariae TaxID=289078 RepID=A0A2X0LC50_9BASI|nr:BZ3500_MvSof-1268-A1-R1_Chr1-1g01130 [Microbotryum saponariae]SCZ93453.1 BZ3501_MvSof-1269-A2-R1_Chr1-1g00727 [Microbotryum saponariae]
MQNGRISSGSSSSSSAQRGPYRHPSTAASAGMPSSSSSSSSSWSSSSTPTSSPSAYPPLGQLIRSIQDLAQPSAYSLSKAGVLLQLKLVLYAFALDRDSPSSHLFLPAPRDPASPEREVVQLGHKFTLSALQKKLVAPNTSSQAPPSTELAPEYSESRRGKICGHVFRAGESVYRCRDCAFDPTCVLCSKCYHASSHARMGHDVTMAVHGGVGAGCCDCGDDEAFKPGTQDDCRYHSIRFAPQPSERSGENSREEEQRMREPISEVERWLVVLIDWMIAVLDRSPSEFVPPQTVDDIIALLPPPVPGLTPPEASDDADALAADLYAMRSGQTGHAMFLTPTSASRVASISQPYFPFGSSRPRPSHSPSSAGTQTPTGETNPFSASTSPPSYVSSTSRGKARATSPSPSTTATTGSSPAEPDTPAGPWSVVLWNDEKHSFEQVIDQVTRATGVSRKRAAAMAQEVDTHGRAIIVNSNDPDRLVAIARLISNIDLAVTVRLSTETFYEQVVGEVIHMLRDLANVDVGGKGNVLTETMAKILLAPYPSGEKGGISSTTTRFQKLLQADSKLWKDARKNLAEFYVVLLGIQFARMYSSIAETYLLTDREPENSIIFFAVQVFTAPSIAARLMSEYAFLSHLISLLYAFFTEQFDPAHNRKRLRLPPNPTIRRIDPESAAFKQKRYFQIFNDLDHLIQSKEVKKLICVNPQLVLDLSAFLDLFTSMNPNVRAVDTHVEYESDAWVTAFNATIQLGKLARAFGESFEHATTFQLVQGLMNLLGRMARNMVFETLEWAGQAYQVPSFKVANSPVSFHHPLGWLFAEMCKHTDKLVPEMLRGIGLDSLGDLVTRIQGHATFLTSMDHPLRAVVLVAQIRAGLWVRNGFGIRAQQLHYKEYSLHENTYDQDVYFLQTSLVIANPSHVFVALLARFDVHEWLGQTDLSQVAHPIYEPSQAMMMVEELLYLLIVLVSDPTHVAGLSSEQVLRRELIHNLSLGPTTFSDLMRRTSERFTDDSALERVLGEVSTFKQPVGNSDQGTYALREEFYTHVNPHFPRFSRNQREEADKIVRAQLKKTFNSSEEPVIVPSRLEIRSGPFIDLAQALESEALLSIVFHALRTGRGRGESLFSEVVLDEALHLVMLALIERPHALAAFALKAQLEDAPVDPNNKPDTNLVHVLVKLEDDERVKSIRPKAKWCLDRLSELLGAPVQDLRTVVDDSAGFAKATLEKKRQAAKARQAAILKKFQQQQASFLASAEANEGEETTEDEEMAVEGGPEEVKASLGSCIVCQDDLDCTKSFGTLAFVQVSNLIRVTASDAEIEEEVLKTPVNLDRDASHLRPFGIASHLIGVHPDDESGDGLGRAWKHNTVTGLHASACGHMMHFECFKTYYKSIEARHLTQPMRCHPENTLRREFICPLCKTLGNALLPTTIASERLATVEEASFDEAWVGSLLDVFHPEEGANGPEGTSEAQEGLKYVQVLGSNGMHLLPWKITSKIAGPIDDPTPELRMAVRLFSTIDPLAQEAFGKAPRRDRDAARRSLPHDLLTYTVESLEIAARGQANESGMDGVAVSETTGRMLRCMFYAMRLLVDVPSVYRRLPPSTHFDTLNAVKFAVFSHIGGMFNPSWSADHPLFSLNPLATLIETAAVAPEYFHHVIAFTYYTELVQTYLKLMCYGSYSTEVADKLMPEAIKDVVDKPVERECLLLAQIERFFSESYDQEPRDRMEMVQLGKCLYTHTLPFLRQASILHRTLFGNSARVASRPGSERTEYSRLLELLRIRDPSGVLLPESSATYPEARYFQSHIHALRDQMHRGHSPIPFELTRSLTALKSNNLCYPIPPARLHHPTIYELAGLPRQLDTLVAASLATPCNACGLVSDSPALCLLCGEFVCAQSFCCMDSDDEAQHGECNSHMWGCGGTVGIYYMVKRNSLLYLYTDKGSFAVPPYLDSHGEVDLGGRRSRLQYPQYLHKGRYDEVRKLWLNHALPTIVARKLDATTDNVSLSCGRRSEGDGLG